MNILCKFKLHKWIETDEKYFIRGYPFASGMWPSKRNCSRCGIKNRLEVGEDHNGDDEFRGWQKE